jgi:hypothetical protein
MNEQTTEILKNFPFLVMATYSATTEEYIGIVGNKDSEITSIYLYNRLQSMEEKKLFLELADKWWWETNRQIPINISLRKEWGAFKYTLCSFVTKELTIIDGHIVSLNDIAGKRIKRKHIELVKIV